MSFSFFIAFRYFVSRKKPHFIHIITFLSMISLAFTSAALVIVLSVFNGLEDLMKSVYKTFDPPIKIQATEGKSFVVNDSLLHRIGSVSGVQTVTEVIEDYAYLRYQQADRVVILKGVGDNFSLSDRLGKLVTGSMKLTEDRVNYAIVGYGVKDALGINLDNPFDLLDVFYLSHTTALQLPSSYQRMRITPSAIFSIEKYYDENYVLVPLRFALQLLDYGDRRTSLEVMVHSPDQVENVARNLNQVLGKSFRALTDEEQHRDLYQLVRMEKLFTTLSFVLLISIASVNLFLSLMMLVMEKKRDISVLISLGASVRRIRQIFLWEGVLISCTGAGVGLAGGWFICWLQQTVGLVSLGVENALVLDYPIKMVASDFGLSFLVVVLVTLLFSFYPAKIASLSKPNP